MDNQTPKKPNKIWRVVLVLSLAMNLAVVGLVAGFSARSAGGHPPQSFEFGLGPIGQALTRDQQRQIGSQLRNDPQMRNLGRRAGKRLAGEVAELLRAEPFDPADLDVVLSEANTRMTTLQGVARSAFTSQVAEMSDQERKDLADRLDEISKKRGRR